ncbi:protein FANTASTIC FOUR 4-like [Nicotiana sylvestris]|uniref:SPX and EXS domain-containing protein 5-like n=1 Tax=Nicotiana sylvestris TaxID=4096 RepID=A0A1U7YI06_NICSY|nr:PREDICTED: SPX and EXS domain-containing protein 5-like [Nicotiana sylvestris]
MPHLFFFSNIFSIRILIYSIIDLFINFQTLIYIPSSFEAKAYYYMMSLCNKNVHPFLSLANSKHSGTLLDFSLPRRNIFTAASAGGSIDTQNPNNYLVSTAMTPPPATAEKKDPGGIGFLDDVGGSVDGLMSCTESLGFESSDERTVDDQIEDHDQDDLNSRKSYSTNMASYSNSKCWQRSNSEKKEKKFPPPLSSLNQDGKPNFFMRAVRKDGRLELTEVKISRPETLLASRQDGRLRLHLIRNEEEEETEEENDDFPLDDEEEVIETIQENNKEILDEEGEEKVGEWKFPVTSGGSGDGVRRCYGGHHHHGHNNHRHDLHVWRQHCVTTR